MQELVGEVPLMKPRASDGHGLNLGRCISGRGLGLGLVPG